MDIFSLMKEGGFIMFPLLVCSLLVWFLFFERLYFLRQFKFEFQKLLHSSTDLIKKGEIEEAKKLRHRVNPLIASAYFVIFEDPSMPLEKWQNKMNRRLKETRLGMRKNLWLLGTIGSSAPFIGLFGTVVGIIKSFESISESGKSGFAVVASGLGEALVATASGIIVAVMAVIFFNYFQQKTANLSIEVKNRFEDLRELF